MGHDCCRFMAVLWSLLIFLGSIACMCYFFYMDADGWPGGDLSKSYDLGEDYPTMILPADWVFVVMWPIIYLLSFIWLGYSISTLCRAASPGTYLYYDPPYIPLATYLCFAFTRIVGCFWLFMADRGYFWENLIVMAGMVLFATIALFAAVVALDNHRETLLSIGRKDDAALTVGFVHNGLAMYATWLLMTTLMQLNSCMVYLWNVEHDTACYVTLTITAFLFLALFFVDNFGIYHKTKFLFTPYVVVIVTFAGITVRNISEDYTWEPVNIMVMAILGVAVLCLIIKIIVIIAREHETRVKSGESFEVLTTSKGAPTMYVEESPKMIEGAATLPAIMPSEQVFETQMVPALPAPEPMVQPATLPMVQQPVVQPVAYPAPQPVVQPAMAPMPMLQYGAPMQAQGYPMLPAPVAQPAPPHIYTNTAMMGSQAANPRMIDSTAEGAISLDPTYRSSRTGSIKDSFYVASN